MGEAFDAEELGNLEERSGLPRISLSSVMLFITVVAVGSAAARLDLFLGLTTLILLLPALLSTVVQGVKRARIGRKFTATEKILHFVLALVATLVIESSACLAFLVTCISTVGFQGVQQEILAICILAGVLAALVTGLIIFMLKLVFISFLRGQDGTQRPYDSGNDPEYLP